MNIRALSVTACVLAICGGVGWFAGRGGSALCGQCGTPRAAIQPVVETKPVSDEEAKERVLQLIHAEALAAPPKIEIAIPDTVDGSEPPLLPSQGDADRFDIWMWLFVPSPLILNDDEEDELKDFFKVESEAPDAFALRNVISTPEAKSPKLTLEKRMRRDFEECPLHPEVDTLEYRSSDGKKGEYEKFQRKVW